LEVVLDVAKRAGLETGARLETSRAYSEIVGRETELAALNSFVLRSDGSARALVLGGSPGIGKTTLWEAGVEFARHRGLRVLSARPGETEAQMSFAALADLLETVDSEAFDALPALQKHALEVAILRAEPGETPTESRAIPAALLRLLRVLAENRGLVVAIDDCQWLDSPSAEALSFVARRLEGDDGVVFLLAKRAGTTSELLEAFEPEKTELAQRIEVEGLSIGAIRRVLAQRLDLSLPRRALRELYELTQGNPLFALEVGRVITARGDAQAGEPLPAPEDVRALVREHVEELPATTRELLLGSALLRRADVATLRAVWGRPIERSLAPAERAGIATLERGAITFAHPLYAAAVVAASSTVERREMHAKLAESVPDSEERARHLALSIEDRDEGAARWIHDAAREAFLRGASTAAAELAELALEIGEPESSSRPRRILDVAAYLRWAGDPERGINVLNAIDDLSAWEPELQARACGELLSCMYWSNGAVAATALGERILEEHPSVEVQVCAHAHLSHYYEFDLRRAAAHGDAALEILEELGERADPAVRARALAMRARNQVMLGEGLERDLIAEVMELEERLAAERPASERLSPRFAALFKNADDLDTSREWLERYLAEATAADDEFIRQIMVMHLALTECWAGNLRRAAEYVALLERIVDEGGLRDVALLGVGALVEAHLGDVDSVRAYAARAAAEHGNPGEELWGVYLRAGIGLLELSLGDAGAADEQLQRALETMHSGALLEPALFRLHGNAAEAAVAVGDLERADAIADELAEHAERTGYRWTRATSERVRALVSAARGDLDAAASHAELAIAAHDELPMPLERARTLLVAGVIERRRRHRGRASALIAEAASEFERMGARLWAKRAHEELERIGGRRRSNEALTPTERRIVELAAEGLSNKEIASTLFVTVHTVEVHLSHAYAKLGVHSRSQLARALTAGSLP
jgi:DNA-binding CsgD family transcriptional regulator/DNA polymerase III delta prime subunit